MKQMAAKLVVSLAIFASTTSAAKVRAVDSTLTSAEVVQQAYEKKLISTNVRKALNNASLLLEAAHSAGLPWSMSDAHHVILDSTAAFEQSLALRKDEPEETYEGDLVWCWELDEGPIFREMRKKCGEDVNRNLKVSLCFFAEPELTPKHIRCALGTKHCIS